VTFVLEDNVPVTPRRNAGKGGRRGSKYPFAQMQPGQSFLVPEDVRALTVRSAVGAFNKRHQTGSKFAVRVTPEGTRVWRVQ
jgi:hypothetical protein